MGIYINPGNQNFQRAVNSEIYVDKTELIAYTNKCLNTQQGFLCVSRPRRFGKSMALNMLAAYYGSGCDSRELFKPYKIAKDKDFDGHLNKYNVIYLNIQQFLSEAAKGELINYLQQEVMEELYEGYGMYLKNPDMELGAALRRIYAKTGRQFIFLIDEWDCVMRVKNMPEELQKRYLDFLRNLLKDQPYVALAYMTGILPIKKYGEHSALNMFDEYSMINAIPISEFTGFTVEEVKELCERYSVPFEETKKWYDGYTVDDISVYNPESVVSAILRKSFDSYWNSTETYDALKVYICMDMDGLRDKVTKMVSGEQICINTTKFQNDMTAFGSADDVLTLLIYLGYLTYDKAAKSVRIPNYEVLGEFVNSITDGGWENVL